MRIFTLLSLTLLPLALVSQSAKDYTVLLQAEADSSAKTINLTWDDDPAATGYMVYQKEKFAGSWGAPIANLGAGQTSHLVENVSVNEPIEFRVVKSAAGYTGYGYVLSGIGVQLDSWRGECLLLIESFIAQNLTTEIQTLQEDLFADGYWVYTEIVSKDTTVDFVKDLILDHHSEHGLNMLYILGHVPVPYSGNLAPDGHVPDHLGAWPADVFYGELDGLWTDFSVNNSNANDPRNDNVPGDGKFDQSEIPNTAELMVGRVDFANLTAFQEDEIELTKRYLNRVHAYKHAEWTLPKRALIDDNFGGFGGEAFASNGWRNFAPLISRDSISSQDYRTTLATDGYLFSYGCGGGTHTSAGGIGNSTQLAGDSLLTGFTMLFGSYFGDWDRENNFMRSALAQGKTMSISWAGRPWWYYHRMGQGSTLGACALLTQNNQNTFFSSYGDQFVHIALLGDPSLRMDYIAPPTQLTADTTDTFHVSLSWTASTDQSISGYHVYRSINQGDFLRLTNQPLNSTQWVDSCVLDSGSFDYVVRAVKYTENFSGSYWNESLGASAELEIESHKHLDTPVWDYSTAGGVYFLVSEQPYSSTLWFASDSTFTDEMMIQLNWSPPFDTTVVFTVSNYNSCESASLIDSLRITAPAGLESSENVRDELILFPNPVQTGAELTIRNMESKVEFSILNLNGEFIQSGVSSSGKIQIPNLSAGIYLIQVSIEGSLVTERISVVE